MTDDMSAPTSERADRPDWWTDEHEAAALEGIGGLRPIQSRFSHDEPSDPIDVAEQFNADAFDEGEAVARWLVAEARHQRDVFLRETLKQGDALSTLRRTIEAYQRVHSDMALKVAKARAGATPDYVHNEAVSIAHPGDLLAWLFDLDEAHRLEFAERVIKHADEAGRCFYEDHAGRIETLTNQVALLQRGRSQHAAGEAPRAADYGRSPGQRLTSRADGRPTREQREALADANYPETAEPPERCGVCGSDVQRDPIDVSAGTYRQHIPGPWYCSADPRHVVGTEVR